MRAAADIVAECWAGFAEVHAIAVIGSVARPLWKEVPRFREFRRSEIEVWHECGDLDLALWVRSTDRLGDLRRAADRALRRAYDLRPHSITNNDLDVFLFAVDTDRHLGRLCPFNQCPKGRRDCFVPGCGAVAFAQVVEGFTIRDDLLTRQAVLYRRGEGRVMSALELPSVAEA